MPSIMVEWLSANYIELLGAILGVAYIIFSIRQNILTWPTGLATSILYIIIFFQAKFYADMSLQLYYVFISIYGWILWMRGSPENNNDKIKVTRITPRIILLGSIASVVIFIPIYLTLKNYTDSSVPIMDSATTALSIVATYFLARKILEHWLMWIVIDLVSAGLYIYKSLWPTTILFLVYTFMAFIGYFEWRKDLKQQQA